MLEIKNLTKIYKTKGGADVKALDDVSIAFSETGLVFLLGKSGSGKSTLLNLAGGLDEPTSGEVIVMGKSSKEFSGGDFDSYRNTFVGFVFQEYNVLNEFTVEENIALALELQGKKKNQQRIHDILKEVELDEFAKRKPNTLSGGQKQRIAIARALIKDPQIIMADEPTGALDSVTGKQVFETLKQLSKTRLVIVVSHDREFAELYGDRIVELKDGKIISDVSKVTKPAEAVSERVMRIGEDTLSVRGGADDAATLAAIQKFLKESDGELLISRSDRDIASFKRANRISEDGAREQFLTTAPDSTPPYKGESAKFIRSKLPASKAIKIGASNLKIKPFRLITTIFLSFAAFVLFGLFSTMMFYNTKSVLVQSFMDSNYNYIPLQKSYEIRVTQQQGHEEPGSPSAQWERAKFTPAEIKSIGGDEGFGAWRVAGLEFVSNIDPPAESAKYYEPRIKYLAVLPEDHPLRRKITGNYPAAADEICVSSYLLDCAVNGSYYAVNSAGDIDRTPTDIKDLNSFIGKIIQFGSYNLKIVGVFDSGEIARKYDVLKGNDSNTSNNERLANEFISLLDSSLYQLAFTTQELVQKAGSTGVNNDHFEHFAKLYDEISVQFENQQDVKTYFHQTRKIKVYDPSAAPPSQYPIVRFDGGSGALKDDEFIANVQIIVNYADTITDIYMKKWEQENPEPVYPIPPTLEALTEYNEARDAWDAQHKELKAYYNQIYKQIKSACDIANGQKFYDENLEYRKPNAEEEASALALIQEFMNEFFEEGPLNVTFYQARSGGNWSLMDGDYKIVGFYYDADWDIGYYSSQSFYDTANIWFSETTETKYEEEADAMYLYLFAPIVKNSSYLSKLFAKIGVKNPDTDIFYGTNNSLYDNVMMTSEYVHMLSTIFLGVGLGLALFASLMLFNFISVSISNKKKEIGILRAVGARGTDVFKIFFAESGIIVGICTVLALIGTIGLSIVLNNVLKSSIGIAVSIFVFGPVPALVMIALAAVVAFIATYLPVRAAAKKKPVDSIRAL